MDTGATRTAPRRSASALHHAPLNWARASAPAPCTSSCSSWASDRPPPPPPPPPQHRSPLLLPPRPPRPQILPRAPGRQRAAASP
eukprot:6198415-Pyramimonas_sp.AAC.1